MQAGAAIDQTSVKPTNLQGGSNYGTPVEKNVQMSNGNMVSEQTAQDLIDKYNATLIGG
jgi:hypothetical protein